MSTLELEALLALQDLDTHIDQEQHRKAHLPARAELAELAREASAVHAARTEIASSVSELAARQDAAERELKVTEARVGQVNKRLYGGTVTASRELQAMSNDVESLRKRASELEDRILAFMDEREPSDAQLAALDSSLADLASRQELVAKTLAAAEEEVDEVLASLQAKRPTAASALSPQLLSTYDRLRARLGGVAVARLVGGRCDGCHLSLPAMELDRVRHQSTGSLEHCEQCGRLLVISGT
jgi:predicted  nucleic acid-binding Zn-ribbon protein